MNYNIQNFVSHQSVCSQQKHSFLLYHDKVRFQNTGVKPDIANFLQYWELGGMYKKTMFNTGSKPWLTCLLLRNSKF